MAEPASLRVMALVSMTRAKTRLICDLLFNLVHTLLMPLYYGESSLRISSWYISPLFLYDPSNSYLLPKNYFNRHCFFLLILLIYFLRTPLHGIVFYSFTYPLCLFPSYLNHAYIYVNQISTTIYLMYPLHVKEFTS